MKKKWFIALVSVLMLTAPLVSTPKTQAQPRGNCTHVRGHIAGQVIGLSPLCDGALTEIGTFTDRNGNPLGTFVACVTGLEEEGNGVLNLHVVHTYTTNGGDTFTTADDILLTPIAPPLYRVNNRAIVTGGTGIYEDAFGRIKDRGTFDFQTGVVSVDYKGRICTGGDDDDDDDDDN